VNRDDIIRMAREAGLHSAVLLHIYEGKEGALTDSEQDELRRLIRFAALAYEAGAAAEREACANLCDAIGERNEADHDSCWSYGNWECANAIRARGEA
jgi:hypothetical protein